MVGSEPRIENFDLKAAVSKNQDSRRLLAPMACVALDADPEERHAVSPVFRLVSRFADVCRF